MARVTVEDCTERVPNRFKLVALAAQRSKHLSSGALSTIEDNNDKNPVKALREIAEGTIHADVLEEGLIAANQNLKKVDVVEEENLYAEAQEAVHEEDYAVSGSDLFVGESHSDLENEQHFSDNIIEDDIKK